MATSKSGPWKMLAAGTVLGAGLVLAAAVGMRFTDSRPFCSTCHVMREAALTHSQSPHARLSCNDCHAPQDLLDKLPFKAKEGLRDVVANVQGKEAPLLARLETREVVNANCRSCHAVTNQDVMMAKPYCVDCHKGMAHQKKTPVSLREAADG
ncbi:MAG: NapC/NirT family cytochrome c [Desulfovibrionaceae bacterium]|nr:NapC/NirT family cytochrome c [Desulfovibrionaceae bacterium]